MNFVIEAEFLAIVLMAQNFYKVNSTIFSVTATWIMNIFSFARADLI